MLERYERKTLLGWRLLELLNRVNLSNNLNSGGQYTNRAILSNISKLVALCAK